MRPALACRIAEIVLAVIVIAGGSCRLEASAHAQSTYYVSPTGSDANPGTVAQPFLTVQKGVSSVAPGDTIVVRDGTYTPPPSAGCNGGKSFSFMVTIDRSGTPSSPITLKAEHKWGAILDAQLLCGWGIYLGAQQYWNIEDFDVRNAYWVGMAAYAGASNLTITGNKIHDIGRRSETSTDGIAGVYAAAGSDRITFDRNIFHTIGRTGGKSVGMLDHGLYLHSTNTIVTNNTFHEPIEGWGIQTAVGFSGKIANNTLHGPNPYGYAGLIVLWDPNGEVTIQNNIFYNPAVAAIHLYHWSATACAVTNNLVYGTDALSVRDADLAGCTQTANLMDTDPLFVDVAQHDYHLQCGSPAIDQGVSLPYVPIDFDAAGRPQGQAYDIGADEGACCGNGTTEVPELCDDGDLIDGDGCDSNCTPTGCGNGITTVGEQCDDGNTATGDCCGATCQIDADGTTCDDANPCTTTDACATGACTGDQEPDPLCKTGLGGQLQIKDRTLVGAPHKGNQLTWRWKKGADTTGTDLGNALSTAVRYDLCIYDQNGGSSRLGIPGGGICRGKACWKASSNGALKYTDRDATPDGVTGASLRPGLAGKAQIQVKAKGLNLAVPSLPFTQSPAVVVQLRSSTGVCWGQTYTAPASRNDAGQFKDEL